MQIHRAFRFRLRTLFVVLTVFAAWFGWQVKTVRDRAAVRQDLVSRGAHFYASGRLMHGGPIQDSVRRGARSARLSWLRRSLGDEIVADILLPGEPAADDLATIDRYFPESRVLGNVVFYDSTQEAPWQPITAEAPTVAVPAAQSPAK